MILTGKAKEDFTKWASSNYELLIKQYNTTLKGIMNPMPSISEYGLFIEFFDGKGILIDITPSYDKMCKYNRGFDWEIIEELSGITHIPDYDCLQHRQEAIKSAIKKANEIYNERI